MLLFHEARVSTEDVLHDVSKPSLLGCCGDLSVVAGGGCRRRQRGFVTSYVVTICDNLRQSVTVQIWNGGK